MTSSGNSLPSAHNITRVELPNGITLLVYENFAAQSVVFSGSLNAGSLYESPAQNWLAAITASALMRGTDTRDFQTIASALEDIGADLDVSAGLHRVGFSGKSLAEDLPLMIELLADVLLHPAFPTAQVERLRGEILTGLQIRSQDTRYRARRAFYEALYPAEHPYHYSTGGKIETPSAITIDQMRQFHRTQYGPQGMILVVVGAVKADDVIAIIRHQFEGWSNPEQPPVPTLPSISLPEATRRTYISLAGKTQSDLILGSIGPSRFAPDYLASMLVNCVLGQFGMMGRIGATVREELGLAYYAYSALDGGLGPSPWSVIAGVNPANLDLAINQIRQQLQRITTELVSEEDLNNVQSYFVGRLPLQLESNEGIVGAIMNMELYGLGLDYLLGYRDRIQALTREDLLRAAQHYLNPEAYVLGIAGPATT